MSKVTLTVLSNAEEGGKALTKTFRRSESGSLEKEAAPMVKRLNSREVEVDSLSEMLEAMKEAAAAGDCLQKGRLRKQLDNESRADQTLREAPTNWLCFDVDGLAGINTAAEFIKQILPSEFHRASYIEHHSSSVGVVEDAGLRVHLFFMLEDFVDVGEVRQWAVATNYRLKLLKDSLSLSSHGIALKYPLDVGVNGNDKLLYIADPICEDGVEDKMAGQRFKLVERVFERVPWQPEEVDSDWLDDQRVDNVERLRSSAGLPKTKLRTSKTTGLLLGKPDRTNIVIRSINKDFVKCDLGNGDSGAYWHKVTDPSVMHNFKGEPPVKTEDLEPGYAQRFMKLLQRMAKDSGQPVHFVYDDEASRYHCGTWWPELQRVETQFKSSHIKVKAFFKENNMPAPDPEDIPAFKTVYDPKGDPTKLVDLDEGIINKWQPSDYQRDSRATDELTDLSETAPWTYKVIRHALGDDDECVDHWLNWLAVIFQQRIKTQTAWLLQGTEGTGKGVLANHVIRPLLGEQNFRLMTKEKLDDAFNGEIEEALFLMIDEVEVPRNSEAASKLAQDLKNLITEPTLRVRRMYQEGRQRPSHINIMLSTNQYEALKLSAADRRYSVGVPQTVPLNVKYPEIGVAGDVNVVDEVTKELGDFATWLQSYSASVDKARTPLDNEAKHDATDASMTVVDQFARALKEGDLQFLIDIAYEALPTGMHSSVNYEGKKVVDELIKKVQKGEDALLTSHDAAVLYSLATGRTNLSSVSVGRALAARGVTAGRHYEGPVQRRGYMPKWQTPDGMPALKVVGTSSVDEKVKAAILEHINKEQ